VRAWDAVVDALPGLDPQQTEGRIDVARRALAGYDKWLAGRVLRAVARRAGLGLTPTAAGRVATFSRTAASGRRLDVPGGLVAEVAFDRVVVMRPEAVPGAVALEGDDGALRFGRYEVAWRRERAPRRIGRAGWSTWFVPAALVVRAVEAGDRLLPLGGVGRRKVARLLMDAKVPRGARDSHPVVVADGSAAWVPGVCRGAGALPAPGSDAVRVDVTLR